MDVRSERAHIGRVARENEARLWRVGHGGGERLEYLRQALLGREPPEAAEHEGVAGDRPAGPHSGPSFTPGLIVECLAMAERNEADSRLGALQLQRRGSGGGVHGDEP